MCGIVGFLSDNDLSVQNNISIIREMISKLSRRGPDDNGEWIEPEFGVVLGHSCLSVFDNPDFFTNTSSGDFFFTIAEGSME